jgi:hypothetical protein
VQSFARWLQRLLGKMGYVWNSSKRALLSDASVEEVATRVAYAEGAILRTLLRRRLNPGIKEIRRSDRPLPVGAPSERRSHRRSRK